MKYGNVKIKVDSQGNPILNQFSEEGFIDCVFKIRNLEESEKYYKFYLSASYNNEELGFNVEVIKNMQAGFDDNMEIIKEYIYRNSVVFLRSGIESDRLITVLSKLYGLKLGTLKMVKREMYTAIALHQGKLNMNTEPIKIKIFGRDLTHNTDKEYNESYFNLDLANGFVFWNEKNQEYREPLIHTLSE